MTNINNTNEFFTNEEISFLIETLKEEKEEEKKEEKKVKFTQTNLIRSISERQEWTPEERYNSYGMYYPSRSFKR